MGSHKMSKDSLEPVGEPVGSEANLQSDVSFHCPAAAVIGNSVMYQADSVEARVVDVHIERYRRGEGCAIESINP